jgi:major type 1 subunit fimbrin (pilin)
MNKLALITTFLSITAITPLAQATSGTINFTGKITAATCEIKNASGSTINIPLGSISVDDVKEVGASSLSATGTTTIDVECKGTTGLNTVAMKFDPAAGSGFASDNLDLLALTPAATGNGATNVGIGLLDENNSLIKLGSGGTLDTALAPVGTAGDATAKILVRAAYFKTTATTPTPGEANGTMAFTMSYK